MSKGIKYISLFENSGYGVAANGYLKTLIQSDLPVTWTPMVRGKSIGLSYEPFPGEEIGIKQLETVCNKKIDYDTVIVHTVPEFYSYWRRKERDKYMIGYTVWETTKPPDHWIELINQLDHVLVPTEWNKTVFREHGINIPIDVIPHLSQFEGKHTKVTEPIICEDDRYLFYIISTWTERKAIWKLIDAYVEAFQGNNQVELLIKTSMIDTTRPRNIFMRYLGYPFKSVQSAFKKQVGTKKVPKITLVDDDTKSEEYLRALHMRGDCYISLCRSEGWGIGSFEAACFGKPIIMTGYGGQTEYLHPDYSWLVDYDLIPVEDPNASKSYNLDQKWAEPDVQHAANLMKYVYNHQDEAKEKGERLRNYVEDRFGNKKTSEKFIRLLRDIEA